MGAAEMMEPWWQRKVRESTTHREMHKENTTPKPLAGKIRGADFCEFCNQQDSKTGVLEVYGLGWNRGT